MKKINLLSVVAFSIAVALVGASSQVSQASQEWPDELSFSTSLHGQGVEFSDRHLSSDRPGGGCIHQAHFQVLGSDRANFVYRVVAPDMATAHSTSLLVALGIVQGLSPDQVVGVLNQAGFGVQIRVEQAGAIPPGPPHAVAHLVDLMKAAIDVASDRPGGGCAGLMPRLDSGLVALGFAGSCVHQQCQGPNCLP